jgi:hypothetical protein
LWPNPILKTLTSQRKILTCSTRLCFCKLTVTLKKVCKVIDCATFGGNGGCRPRFYEFVEAVARHVEPMRHWNGAANGGWSPKILFPHIDLISPQNMFPHVDWT